MIIEVQQTSIENLCWWKFILQIF